MGSEDKGWASVANNLLGKCHVNRQVRDVTDCDARIFVSLYEAILGEKVPGENVVRGDGESIGNLLEIFDGLLEYLTEQISEASSQNGDDLDHVMDFHQRVQHAEITGGEKDVLPTLRPAPSAGSSQPSSDLFVPSWEVDGSESTAELIRLGETAHTFTIRGSDLKQSRLFQKGETSVTPRPEVLADRKLSESAPGASRLKEETPNERPLTANGFSTTRQLQEETPSAIPLQRPYQPKETRPVPSISTDWSSPTTPVRAKDHTASERANGPDPSCSTAVKNLPAGPSQDATLEENLECRRLTSPARASLREEPRGIPATAETLSAGHKKVAFRTLPDVRYMTLRSTLGGNDEWASGSEREDTTVPDSVTLRLPDEEYPTVGSEGSLLDSRRSDTLQESLTEEPLSLRRARNKVSEQELQEMSEKLSRRLAELDHMLKAAIGEQGAEPRDEDKLSQHSDSIMEFRRKKQLQAAQHAKKLPSRPRSLSSSPPPLAPPRHSLCAQFEDALNKEAKGETGKVRRGVQKELDQQRAKSQFLTQAYEEELKDFEERERGKLSKLKTKLKEKEQECKENIFKAPPRPSQPEKVYVRKTTPRTPKPNQCIPSPTKPRRPSQMKIKDNDLLPLLLDEFPYLHISPHALNKMWKEQVAQMEQLTKSAQGEDRSEKKLQSEVETAHKKHDLLVEIIKKEQGHNQRLKEFKERIRLQKSAQNKLRDNRRQVARANKYYEDYHVQLGAKLLRARTREERMFKKLFEEGLDLQKERLREMRSYTKEQREEQRKRHKDELESMENYYKDQFSMLAEAVTDERHEIQAREKAQAKALHNEMKRELRAKMEERGDPGPPRNDHQDGRGRVLPGAGGRTVKLSLKRRIQMASFQYGKSHVPGV
ncbi:hypothetical protein FKM82_007973 [Ascaphus truei]